MRRGFLGPNRTHGPTNRVNQSVADKLLPSRLFVVPPLPPALCSLARSRSALLAHLHIYASNTLSRVVHFLTSLCTRKCSTRSAHLTLISHAGARWRGCARHAHRSLHTGAHACAQRAPHASCTRMFAHSARSAFSLLVPCTQQARRRTPAPLIFR